MKMLAFAAALAVTAGHLDPSPADAVLGEASR